MTLFKGADTKKLKNIVKMPPKIHNICKKNTYTYIDKVKNKKNSHCEISNCEIIINDSDPVTTFRSCMHAYDI